METSRARIPAAERREQVLDAATRAFARTGFAGTTTDAVAREAGVSQPYVVRMFGSKHDLVVAVLTRTHDRIAGVFTTALEAAAERGEDLSPDGAGWEALGSAYADLVADQDLLAVMMHGFAGGADETVAATSRAGMARIVEVLTAAGADVDDVRDFVAHGMLINVLLSMRAPAAAATDALAGLTAATFGDLLGDLATVPR